MERPRSIPVRLTANGYLSTAAAKLAAVTVTAKGADVNVHLRDGGASGEIKWTIEADASAGSHTVSFGNYPIVFETDIYMEADVPGNLVATSGAIIK